MLDVLVIFGCIYLGLNIVVIFAGSLWFFCTAIDWSMQQDKEKSFRRIESKLDDISFDVRRGRLHDKR